MIFKPYSYDEVSQNIELKSFKHRMQQTGTPEQR